MNKLYTPKGYIYYKFKALYPGIKQINKAIANENLKLIKKIFYEQNVFFGLTYGTLLGAIRDKDFINHDEDIDLYIMKEDENKFLLTLNILITYGFKIVRNDRRGIISVMRNGEYIDFYMFSKYNESIRICSGLLIPEKFLTDTIEYYFLGENYYIPREYEQFFLLAYGADWKTPIPYVNFQMNILKRYNVKATFFVGGCWADDNGETLKAIVNSGHEIANHGYFHKDHKKLDYDGNYQEIFLTDKIIEALSGVKPTLFAPPSGSFSSLTLESAFNLNYKVIMWSKDTIDWRDKDRSIVIKRATSNLENGDLVLMHPKEHTLSALPDILSYYKSVGFSVVTVSENIAE